MKGFFVTFEGIEGTGKSTQAGRLYATLKERGYPVYFTREPGGTKIGNLVREILMNPEHKDMCPLTEIFLFAASRAQHVEKVLRPYIEEGYVVICDRFADSTVAYQAFGRGVPVNVVREINSAATWGIQPSITFFLDLEPQVALKRVSLRVQETEVVPDRLEREQLEFFHKVRDGYRSIAGDEPHRFKILDATLDPHQLAKKILDITQREMRKAGILYRPDGQTADQWDVPSVEKS
ncbi:MAG: dTMP kinase [Candidatus Eremiobacteraeota bacterium]|nr:dTMP kinase [Candidatus Eremiobacteraeota bacterium]